MSKLALRSPPARVRQTVEYPPVTPQLHNVVWTLLELIGWRDALAGTSKVRRNQLCPCGSGLKYKRCHGRTVPQVVADDDETGRHVAQHQAAERIRLKQQGLGKPIIAAKLGEHQIVAVSNRLFYSPNWKTFPDFLSEYLKSTLGRDWGNAELAKPLEARHTIMQWYDAYCRYQSEHVTVPGAVAGPHQVVRAER